MLRISSTLAQHPRLCWTVSGCYSDIQCGESFGRDSKGIYVIGGQCKYGRCQYQKEYVECVENEDCPDRRGYLPGCNRYHRCEYIRINTKECEEDKDCDDKKDKTRDICVGGRCRYEYIDTPLDDSDSCNKKCKVDLPFNQEIINPFCFVFCIGEILLGMSIKFLITIGVIFLSFFFLYPLLRKRRKNKGWWIILHVLVSIGIGYLALILL